MKNIISGIEVLMMASMLFFGCSGQSKLITTICSIMIQY